MTSTSWTEEALRFACGDEQLVGVVCRPTALSNTPALGAVIVVGGPQYRAGSHRQFVQWARALAGGGIATLRFDVRGMGDSTGELRSFESLDGDIGAAIDALLASDARLRQVMLCGLCDGASAALLYLNQSSDRRVVGVQLLNPWARSQQSLAKATVKHYYLDRLRNRSFWGKLLRGQVALESVRSLLANVRASRSVKVGGDQGSFQSRMRGAFTRWPGRALLVLSGQDLTAKEFLEYCATDPDWNSVLTSARVKRVDLANADHTLSSPDDMRTLLHESLCWARTLESPAIQASANDSRRPREVTP